MGPRRESHGERHRDPGLFRGIHDWLQCLWICGDFAFQRVRKADRLSVAVENPWGNHRFFRRTAESHRRGDGHPEQHVRRLNVAI